MSQGHLRDCVGEWLSMPSVELARALVWDVSPLRSDRLYNSVRADAAHYERGRLALLSRLVSP